MIKTLKEMFDSFIASSNGHSPIEDETVQLAAAVLLVDVMRADQEIRPEEHVVAMNALQRRFNLNGSDLTQLMSQAEATAKNAYDYHRFTSTINTHFSQEQKIQIIETMWQVAYADAHLDAHENHLISKIAGLLHVTHGEFIGAKMRAKESANLIEQKA